MKSCCWIIIIITYCLTINPCLCQEYLTQLSTLTIRDGLPSNMIDNIFEDSKGFIWIANKHGLCLFDGKNTKNFFQEDTLAHSSHCMKLAEDVNGNFWTMFIEKKGASYSKRKSYYLLDKHYKRHPIDDYFKGQMPFKSHQIKDFEQMPDQTLFIITKNNEIYKYDGNFQRLPLRFRGNRTHISSLNYQKDSIYIFTQHQIIALNRNGEIVKIESNCKPVPCTPIIDDTNLETGFPLFKRKVSAIFREASTIHINQLLKDEAAQKRLADKKSVVFNWKWYEGKYYLVVSTLNYLAIFNENGKLLHDFSATLEKHLGNYTPGDILLRKNQLIFNYYDGIGILNFQPNHFQQYFKQNDIHSTRAIVEISDDSIWVFSYEGTYQIAPSSNNGRQLHDINPLDVWGAVLSSTREIITGHFGSKINKLNIQDKSIHGISLRKKERNGKKETFLIPFEDSQQNIWVGASRGLFRYNRTLDSLEGFQKYNDYFTLKSKSINYFYEDKEGIWLGTSEGLYVLDTHKGITASYQPFPELPIFHFYREGDIFWLATYGKGLVKWNKKTSEAKRYGINQGFLNEYLTAIYPDTMGHLWIGTEKGLARFHKKTEEITIFLESDGITHNEFNRSSHLQAADGRIYMGGMNGVTAFYPTDIQKNNEHDYSFQITDYQELDLNEGGFINRTSQLLEQQTIVLNPAVKSFKLQFALLNYKNTDETRYAYKIEGFYEDWTLQEEHFIQINHLPYGNYTLRIKAKDYTGNWSENELSFPIKVIAPFYQQWQWQLVGTGFITLFFYLAYLQRLRLARKEQERLETIIAERTATISTKNEELSILNQTKDRLFAILAHDLRNPILGFKNLAQKINYLLHRNEPERVLKLGKFIDRQAREMEALLTNLLNWALYERGDLFVQKKSIPLFEMISDLKEKNASLSKTVDVQIVNDVPAQFSIFSDYLILETIFRNLISNAFRYTPPGGQIIISAAKTRQKVVIKVKDSGTGMEPEQLKTLFDINVKRQQANNGLKVSFGLHLCKELTELLNGSIAVESNKYQGTTFFIHLPTKTYTAQYEHKTHTHH